MAVVAVVTAADVGGVFADCRNAIMAGAAGAHYVRVVNCNHRLKRDRAVTIFADTRRLYVQRTLTGRCGAVMATDTVSDNACMVEDRGHPRRDVMAVVTLLARRNMSRRFTGGLNAVVTTTTTAREG